MHLAIDYLRSHMLAVQATLHWVHVMHVVQLDFRFVCFYTSSD